MSIYYNLHCKQCDKGVFAVSSQKSGNNCGYYQETLDFMVEHHGHDLIVLQEDEVYHDKSGKVIHESDLHLIVHK